MRAADLASEAEASKSTKAGGLDTGGGAEEPGWRHGHALPASRTAVGGMTAGLAVALTHALAGIPNVELTSLTLFLGGGLLGARSGAIVGTVAALALSLTNPMGLPHPFLLAAQVLGYGIWGAAGGLSRSLARGPAPVTLGALGAVLTLVFQLLVNLSLMLAFGLGPMETLVPAAPYALVHMAWNGIAFAVLGPALLSRIGPLRRRLGTLAG